MTTLLFELIEQMDRDGNVAPLIRLIRRGTLARPFDVTGTEAPLVSIRGLAAAATPVADAGGFLFSKIMENPDIRAQLDPRLSGPGTETSPILVSLSALGSERYPFEAMFVPRDAYPQLGDGSRFLGLSERFAIGRMVDAAAAEVVTLPFRAPLRISAVLSALNIEARAQWDALQSAVRAAGSVRTVLQVFVSEEALLEDIQASPEITADPRSSVAFVPGSPTELQDRITAFQPHVLHFFCHGTAADSGRLEIATRIDQETRADISSMVLELEQLLGFAPAKSAGDPAWLVLLNCCEVGGVGEDMTSFSLRLMEQGDYGAVIGMSEPVLDTHAALFTKGFYRSLLTEIQLRVDGRRTDPLCWPAIAVAGRREIATKPGTALSAAAAQFKDWTLPVVFVGAREWELAVVAEPALPPFGVPEGADGADGAAPGAGPPPPPPPGGPPARRPEEAAGEEPVPGAVAPSRRNQLEIELLQSMLARLTPESPDALRSDITARLAELGAPVAVA